MVLLQLEVNLRKQHDHKNNDHEDHGQYEKDLHGLFVRAEHDRYGSDHYQSPASCSAPKGSTLEEHQKSRQEYDHEP